MTDSQHCALVLIAVAFFFFMAAAAIDAIRDAFRHANRTIDLALAACADPIDAHFDTAITEPEFCAETFADLRADWPAWEREVSA